MRISTKILSIILVLCFAFTTFGYANTYSDVSESDANYSPISLLSALGIIKGYEDGTFGADRNVTRAEFTVMLVRTLNKSGLGSTDLNGLSFQDLSTVDWAISDIRTAYDLGIINGMSETEFAPDDQVTGEQALKMIVCALGYEPAAIDIAGGADKVWPTGYTTVAGNLKLTAGVSANLTDPAKRGEIARYIYNSLEVDNMQKTEYSNGAVKTEIKEGVNILNNQLKVYYGTGELRADNDSSAEISGTVSRAGEVLIYEDETGANDTFEAQGVDTKGLVGRSIKYYYKEATSGIKTLVYIEDKTKSSSIVKIDPADLDSVDGSWNSGVKLNYWEDDSSRTTTTINIAADPVVSINGRVIDNASVSAKNAFNIDSGSIEIIDTNNDGYYNKVNITSYQTYVVGSVSTSSKMIVDLYKTAADGNTYKLDEDDTQTTLTMKRAANNSTASLSSLSKYNVLSIKESNGSNGKKIIDVIVSNNSVSGTVNSIDLDAKEISIDSKTYTLSNYILNFAATEVKSLEVNDTCKFYLDKDENIAAFEKTNSTNTAYAYMCGVASENDEVIFRLFEVTGARTTPKGASRIKIDGQTYSDPDDVVDVLSAIASNVDGKGENGSQLVKITKNSSGYVSVIDTIAPSSNESENDLKLSTKGTSYRYTQQNNQFVNENDSSDKFLIDSSTIIFSVPSTRKNYSDYVKRNLSYFKDKKTYSNIEVYDLGSGSADKAKCIVIYGSSSADKLYADSPILIYKSKSSVKNSEGDSVYDVSGYLFGAGISDSTSLKNAYTEDTSVMSGASIGDVYRIGYDGSDYSRNTASVLNVSDSSMPNAFYIQGVTGDVDDDYVVCHGMLVGVSDDSFVLAKTNDINDLINGNNVETYSLKTDSNTIFAIYKASENDTNKITFDTENIMKSMENFDDTKKFIQTQEDENGTVSVVSTDGVSASEIFTYVVNQKVVLVYQIIR